MARGVQQIIDEPDGLRLQTESRSRLRWYDCFNQSQVDSSTQQFFYPLEPDYDKLTIWYRFDYAGKLMKDYSLFDNHAKIVGNPRLIEGLSYGLLGGNIAMLCDGDEDYFIGPEGAKKAGTITNLGTSGFSVCTVISPSELISRVSETMPNLFQKIDDNTSKYGYTGKILEDGDLYFEVNINGNRTKKETTTTPLGEPAATPKDFFDLDYNDDYHAGPRYDVVPGFHIIWWVSDGASPPNLKIYVNNVNETLSTSSISNMLPTTDTHDTLIGAGTAGATQFYKGIYQDYRFMKRQVTAQEVDNHFTNKISITDIPYGDVFVIGGARFNE